LSGRDRRLLRIAANQSLPPEAGVPATPASILLPIGRCDRCAVMAAELVRGYYSPKGSRWS
jgi:hypothetical protein